MKRSNPASEETKYTLVGFSNNSNSFISKDDLQLYETMKEKISEFFAKFIEKRRVSEISAEKLFCATSPFGS